MTNKMLSYNLSLKKVKFEEINFSVLTTAGIKGIIYDDQINPKPNIFAFRNMLLEFFSAEIGIQVLNIYVCLTPNRPEFDGFGFLFLENKTIFPVKLEQSKNFKAWSEYITSEDVMDDTEFQRKFKQDWLLNYSKNDCSMSGLSSESESEFYYIESDIFKETGKFLFKNSPNIFNEKKIATQKNNYLKKYTSKVGLGLDITLTIELFHKVIFLHKLKSKPALDNILTYYVEFNTLSGYELPTELKTIYDMCNGVELYFDSAYNLLGIGELVDAWKSWKTIYDEWLLEDLKLHQTDRQKTLQMYTTPYWIPFMTDGNGNYIAIDYAPGKKGKTG